MNILSFSQRCAKSLLVVATTLAVLTGCTIDPAINISPNSPSQATAATVAGINALFVGLQTSAGVHYSGARSRIGGLWTWQVVICPTRASRTQYFPWNNYETSPAGAQMTDPWGTGYNTVKMANDIIEFSAKADFGSGATAERSRNTYVAMAKCYKAFALGELAALYGSIPVELNGTEPPRYVSQREAYSRVQSLLDEALTAFGQGTATLTGDLNFRGDATRWIEVANTLKARYFLHTKNYPAALAAARNGIKAATRGAFAVYSSNELEQNLWSFWVQCEPGNVFVADKYYIDVITSEPNDRRLNDFLEPNEDGQHVGFALPTRYPASRTDVSAAERDNPKYYSTIKKFAAFEAPFPLVTYQENVLILAECLARTGAVSDAVTQVNLIRTAAGLPAFSSTNAADVIAQVLKQKYIQLFLEGQSYHDMRRTGTLPRSPITIPVRLRYPDLEISVNPNTPADSDMLNTELRP